MSASRRLHSWTLWSDRLEEGVPWSARVAAGLVCLTPRSLATIAVWAAVLALGSYVACAGTQEAQAMLASLRASVGLWALILLALAYALALSLPFVPGLELGLLIMVAFGTTGVLVAYAATVLDLCLAYVAGCVLPQRLVPTRLRAGRLALRHADSAGTLAARFFRAGSRALHSANWSPGCSPIGMGHWRFASTCLETRSSVAGAALRCCAG